MHRTILKVIAVGALIAGAASQGARAQRMLRIPIPTRSRLTPVQKLNRKGVKPVSEIEDFIFAGVLPYDLLLGS